MGRLPGPWHTRWTNVVMKYKMFKGQLIEYTEKLHEEYGMSNLALNHPSCNVG